MAKNRLTIAFLSQFSGVTDRGVETYVKELGQRLSQNHNVQILTGRQSNSLGLILKGQFDLVIPTNGRFQALKMGLGRFFGGYKILISGQAGVGKDDIWNLACVCPDVYVALTEYEFNWAKKWSWKTRLVKIPNGVDLKRFKSNGPKIDFGLPPPVILSVGALEWYKHHQRSIKAIASLKKGSLVIIGSGSQKKELTAMGNKFLGSGHFKILTVEHSKIDQYYRSADLFVLPSWPRESFGIVYLEAMACGVPVVAPDDLSRQEIIGKGGILIDVSDENKYGLAIKQALEKNWGLLPRNQAEKYSWDRVLQDYERLLEELF